MFKGGEHVMLKRNQPGFCTKALNVKAVQESRFPCFQCVYTSDVSGTDKLLQPINSLAHLTEPT